MALQLVASGIVNLSTYIPPQSQISVLQRGLKFCPTPLAPNPGDLRCDMDRLHKRLRQIAFFDSPEGDNTLSDTPLTLPDPTDDNLHSLEPFKHRKFKLPAKGKGPPGPQNLESMIAANEYDFQTRPIHRSYRSNLSQSERKAIEELRKNTTFFIRPADKGGLCVLWGRDQYLSEGYRQLSDSKFYQKLDHHPTKLFSQEVANTVEDLFQNGEIDDTVKEFLLQPVCTTPEFYLLAKLHKPDRPVKGRPIVAGCNGPTQRISQFVDHFLNPSTRTLPSFVKDTTHFLQILNDLGTLPPNCLVASLDVSSLYTNIDQKEGLKASFEALKKSRPQPGIKPSNQSLMELLKLVLTKNNFSFNGQAYLQIQGTSMGSRVAPSYAIHALGHFESKFVYTYKLQPLLYLRYIDDIFMIWPHGEEELIIFIDYLNSCTDNFKFTHEFSESNVTFLDTRISIVNNTLISDLYCKPTDSHNYLRYNSAHPQRCKDSIPYSQFLRVRRICTNLSDFDMHILLLSKHFLDRGYPLDLLKEAAIKARCLDRNDLLSTHHNHTKDDGDKVFLITTYHPHDNSLKDVVYKNWDMLGRSVTTDFIHKRHLMCGYRRPKNLRDLLMRAKIPYLPGDEVFDPKFDPNLTTLNLPVTHEEPDTMVMGIGAKPKQKCITDFFPTSSTSRCSLNIQQTGSDNMTQSTSTTTPSTPATVSRAGTAPTERGFSFCNKSSCRYCSLIDKSGKITSSVTHIQYSCMKKVSCRSSNIIYAITCKVCGMQYVGQTLLRVKDRFVHHFRDVDIGNPEKTVGRHFNLPDHKGYKDMTINILEFIKAPPRSPQAIQIRNRVERNWTHVLRSLAPHGLNMENPKELFAKPK